MALTGDDLTLANQALALLRQDVNLTESNQASTSIGIKCQNLVPLAIAEFQSIHSWADGDSTKGDYKAALVYHIASVLAIPITGRQEDHKAFAELADIKARAARVKSLNNLLATTDDKVLLAIVQNFKVDDPQLATAWDMYSARSEAIKNDCKNEILNSHNWTFDSLESSTDENALAYQAYVELCVSKLAVPCGLPTDVAQMYLVKSQATLEKARAKDLLVAARTINDNDTNHVLALIRQIYDADDKAKPLDIAELTERIDAFKEAARKEVLSTYGWNFMRREKRNPPCNASADGRWSTTVPGDALRVLGCYHEDGSKVEYTIHGHKIIANAPPARVLYTVDVDEDISTYPILVRDAILLKIAENVATGLMASASGSINAHKVANLKNDYIRTVQEARTNDAKQVSVGESAWGRNYVADIMLGKRRGKWSARLW